MRMRHWVACIAVLWALGPVAGARASGLSDRMERWLGDYTRSAIEHSLRVETDPLLEDMVARMGADLGEATSRRSLRYRFRVLDVEDVNAISAPGGYVWVTKGALRYVESPDELAAVLGHEAAHIDHRHGWQAFEQDLAFLAVLLALPSGTPTSILQWADNAYFVAGLKFSRDDEYEADREGQRLAFESGYDGAQITTFLARLLAEPEGDASRFEALFMTHPRHRDRIARLEEAGGEARYLQRTGEGLLARRCFAQALLHFQHAIEADPALSAAHVGAACACAFLGRDAEAHAHLDAARAARRSGLVGDDASLGRAEAVVAALAGRDARLTLPRAASTDTMKAVVGIDDAIALLAPLAERAASAGGKSGATTPTPRGAAHATASASDRAELLRVLTDRVSLLGDLRGELAAPATDARLLALARDCEAATAETARVAEAQLGGGGGEWRALVMAELDNAIWRLSTEALRSPVDQDALAQALGCLLALDARGYAHARATTADLGRATLIAALAKETSQSAPLTASEVLREGRPSVAAERLGGNLDNLAIACRLAARSLQHEREALERLPRMEDHR